MEFFSAEPAGFIVLVRRPDDEDIERAALADGFRAGWTEQPMALTAAPQASEIPGDIEVRVVADESALVDYGRVVALANDESGGARAGTVAVPRRNDPRASHHGVRRLHGH